MGHELEIIKRRKEGKSITEIANEFGITKSTVSYYFKKNDMNFSKKITEDKINEIKTLYNNSELTLSEISKETGLSLTTIKKYINPKRAFKYDDDERKKVKTKNVIYWRQRVKQKSVEYKGSCCEMCGYDKCISALEFHHKNPNEKDFSIGGKSISWERIKNELDKCILVCSNCHREIHSGLH
jgi:predicted transcriptional regulator